MEFRETLLAAQRNQQHKSSESSYYKARFDPPKKEQKQKDKLSANIQKFLAKKDEEEKQKKLDAQRKCDELLAMRDPKALRKIQKSLKVFKSANKSVLEDAVDRDNTAVTLSGPDQPDQDDYGYESQEAAAIYAKMMQKYSKIPDVPKFPTSNQSVKKDLKGTMERVKHALQHEDDPVPHKRRRKKENGISGVDKEDSPTRYEPEKKDDKPSKPDKPKFRKPMPPPMDFNQLLKLAEQKKSEPIGAAAAQRKQAAEGENERPMTKRQRREHEEEMARRHRRQERLDADKTGGRKPQKEERAPERERTEQSQRPSGFGRIPKLNDKNSDRNNSPRPADKDRGDRDRGDRDRGDRDRGDRDKGDRDKGDRDRGEREKADKMQRDKDRMRQERERLEREKERVDREKDKIDRERLERLKAERERIDRELERLSKDKERLEQSEKKVKLDNGRSSDKNADRSKLNSSDSMKKSIDLKSQNTYRIDKNSNERKFSTKNDDKYTNGHGSQGKVVPKSSKEQLKNGVKDKAPMLKQRLLTEGKSENGKRLPDNKVPSKRPDDRPQRPDDRASGKPQAGSSKPKISNSFDFDKHVNSLKKETGGKNGARPPPDGKKRPQPDDARKKPNRRVVNSESEYDSEMDDFIDDGDENMDYSKHIKEIFGYDKSKYRDIDDDDDPSMESSFARQQREEFMSKKIGIMEDLEDMRMEALEKKKSKKKRRISDD